MALARGRPFMIPITRNIKDCDTWHRSPIADEQDGPVASMAVMRRNLVRRCNAFKSFPSRYIIFAYYQQDGLFNTVRALCDGSQTSNSDGSLVARSYVSFPFLLYKHGLSNVLQRIQSAIERFFDQWLAEWGLMIGLGPGKLARSWKKSKKCPPTYL